MDYTALALGLGVFFLTYNLIKMWDAMTAENTDPTYIPRTGRNRS